MIKYALNQGFVDACKNMSIGSPVVIRSLFKIATHTDNFVMQKKAVNLSEKQLSMLIGGLGGAGLGAGIGGYLGGWEGAAYGGLGGAALGAGAGYVYDETIGESKRQAATIKRIKERAHERTVEKQKATDRRIATDRAEELKRLQTYSDEMEERAKSSKALRERYAEEAAERRAVAEAKREEYQQKRLVAEQKEKAWEEKREKEHEIETERAKVEIDKLKRLKRKRKIEAEERRVEENKLWEEKNRKVDIERQNRKRLREQKKKDWEEKGKVWEEKEKRERKIEAERNIAKRLEKDRKIEAERDKAKKLEMWRKIEAERLERNRKINVERAKVKRLEREQKNEAERLEREQKFWNLDPTARGSLYNQQIGAMLPPSLMGMSYRMSEEQPDKDKFRPIALSSVLRHADPSGINLKEQKNYPHLKNMPASADFYYYLITNRPSVPLWHLPSSPPPDRN